MSKRALRRYQAQTHMMRRLKEHQAQESITKRVLNRVCECDFDGKRRARFKEQPQVCSCIGCGNKRQHEGPTMQERRAELP